MRPPPGIATPLKYQPHIDGLRAVAVLSVVLYHLGLPLHGGYVGVDIFFTISGYLIGSIILRETAEQRFTFAGFYERRIRRIFPALFVMLFASLILAYFALLPLEFVDFAKSLAAAALSVSNMYFWLHSGYFDAPASTKPLLHTWSLAVEEQFYILLPILLVLLRRFLPRRVDLTLYSIAAGSFLLSIYGAFRFPSTTFYWAHTRAWELLLGTILALESCPRVRRRWLGEVAGISGLVLITAAVLLYHPWTPFPGLAALPPCLGTALILAAGRSGPTLAGRLLSLRPAVYVGLISYSLYLWHWPVIVFDRAGLTLINGLSQHQSEALLLVISLVLAILSWRFVEVPFRTGVLRVGRTALFSGAAIAVVIVATLSTAVVSTQGLLSRYPPKARRITAYLDMATIDQFRNNTCFITSHSATLRDFPVKTCLPDKHDERKLLLLGDSHAAALWWGLDHVLSGENVMQATAAGCKPVLQQRPRQYAACTALMNFALKQYLPTHKVDAVLIEAHWDEGDLPSLGETLAWLHQQHIPVILFGPIVQYDSALPRLLAISISRDDPQLPGRHRLAAIEPLDRQMTRLAEHDWHTQYVSLYQLFCNRENCTEYASNDVPLQSDYGHLTIEGSMLAAQRIAALKILP